ncbi:LysR family transcriptional regulator [Psychromonas marina]|uniref:LysR family transcriptional regulator n=1 Tax=Psychromonas marina TaxID=88364 RepID=A0ABQ6DZD4_9GAMM|nr:LysR family transcriptional regulator [Psychromonas marina]GLS90121.1 LysR family transcriptional regulator [Psychromonas marina]
MMRNKLDDLDLNLLKLLRVVVETRNTHAAAEQLGISQTSVSRGLAKLRKTFGEQLFIRTAYGIEPSKLAVGLADATKMMLAPVLQAVDKYQGFDPLSFDREICIFMNVFLLEVHGRDIITLLGKVLPNAKFKILNWQQQSLTKMLDGECDYFIQLDNYSLPQDIYSYTLKNIPLSIVAKKSHPILSKPYEWNDIHHLPLGRIVIDGIISKHTPIEVLYEYHGYKANIRLVTHSVPLLFDTLKQSSMIILGSTYIAEMDDELASYPLPPSPVSLTSIKILGGYLQTQRNEPLSQLLDKTIQRYFQQLDEPV